MSIRLVCIAEFCAKQTSDNRKIKMPMNFDEMMNKYITILKHTGLYSHQMFIKSIPMMKRERRSGRPCTTTQMMNFSFDEYFDERMMNVYYAVIQ